MKDANISFLALLSDISVANWIPFIKKNNPAIKATINDILPVNPNAYGNTLTAIRHSK